MSSFTVYDPRKKTFRALETASESDLPFEQVLLINILIELRVITAVIQAQGDDPQQDDADELREAMVQEIG